MTWLLTASTADPGNWQGLWIDLALKSSLLLAAAGLGTLALRRRSAATRHLVWLFAFAGLLLLPLFSFALPSWRINLGLPAAVLSSTKSAVLADGAQEPVISSSKQGLRREPALPPAQIRDSFTVDARRPTTPAIGHSVPPPVIEDGAAPWNWLVQLWALGFVVSLLPLFGGCLALIRLRLKARAIGGSRIEEIAQALAERLGIGRAMRVLLSDRSCIPMTWGLRRPLILLPREADRWPLSRLRPVLVHELAHVQRFDCVTQMFAQVVCAVYWFNPLVWAAKKQLRLEQESACDDTVLNAGLDAQQYATQLLSITAGLPAHFLVSSVALAMAKKRTLERRLLAILDARRDRRSPHGHILGFALLALIAALTLLGPMRIFAGRAAVARAAESLTFLENVPHRADPQALVKTLDEVRAKIQNMAVDVPGEKALFEGALRGMLEAMHDPYSSYLPSSDVMPMDPAQASMAGVGVQIRKSETGLTVFSPLPGSPARKAGLKPGDEILAIDGKSVAGMSLADAVNLIRGPVESPVRLTVRSSGHDIELSLVCAVIAIPTVQGFARNANDSWDFLIEPENKIGYIQIANFNGGTDQEFREVLGQLDRKGMNGLILDLRFCPGGLLPSALGVVHMLLDQGNIVTIRNRDSLEQKIEAQGRAILGQRPIVVLINDQTSSAGEIVAGALKENHRAVVIGSRTHGKGSVQTVVNLDGEKGAIKLTTGQMHLPSGRMIQRTPGGKEWGVDPDDGFYMPLSQQETIALGERISKRQVLGQQPSAVPGLNENPPDRQLACAIKALTAKLTKGEFEQVGRPLLEYSADLEKTLAEEARLKKRLAEIERELEILGAKEPKNE